MLVMWLVESKIRGRREEADSRLRWARNEGDWDALADHIRHGGLITPEMRDFIANVLDKTIPAPPVGTVATRASNHIKRERFRAVFKEMKSGISETAAIAIVAEREGVDTSTVRRAVKTCRDAGLSEARAIENLRSALENLNKHIAEDHEQGRSSKIFNRYNLSRNGGLDQYCGTTGVGTPWGQLGQALSALREPGTNWVI